jgi:hypothetical protein
MRFAWQVSPRNYLLFSCHLFNEGVQLTQLGRRLAYDAQQAEAAKSKEEAGQVQHSSSSSGVLATFGAVGLAAAAAGVVGPRLRGSIVSAPFLAKNVKAILDHPAGPFTIFFWAPTMKWALSGANIVDYKRPVDNLSVGQQAALALTGAIWTRYAMVITPVNYNLAIVNVALCITGVYQLARKLVYDPFATDKQPMRVTA